MNKDVLYVERTVYSTFMLLGDVGGLYTILVTIGAIVLSYVNFQKIENDLAERLFVNEPLLKASK